MCLWGATKTDRWCSLRLRSEQLSDSSKEKKPSKNGFLKSRASTITNGLSLNENSLPAKVACSWMKLKYHPITRANFHIYISYRDRPVKNGAFFYRGFADFNRGCTDLIGFRGFPGWTFIIENYRLKIIFFMLLIYLCKIPDQEFVFRYWYYDNRSVKIVQNDQLLKPALKNCFVTKC